LAAKFAHAHVGDSGVNSRHRAPRPPVASLLLARKRPLLALEVAGVAGLSFAADRHVANSPIDADGFPGGGQRFDGFLARERHEVHPQASLRTVCKPRRSPRMRCWLNINEPLIKKIILVLFNTIQ